MNGNSNVVVDMSDDIDKTGFRSIRNRAIRKAQYLYETHFGILTDAQEQPTIGPDAPQTPITVSSPKNKFVAGTLRLVRKNIMKTENKDETGVDDSEVANKFCSKIIESQTEKLCYLEAERAKFEYLKKWQEHDQRIARQIEERKAREEVEALARQQEKLLLLAKRQEEFRQKQQELSLAQINRDVEASRKMEETKKQQLEAQTKFAERMKQQNEFHDLVYKNQNEFADIYKQILEIIKIQNMQTSTSFSDTSCLRAINESLISLTTKCKNEVEVTEADVNLSFDLLSSAKPIYDKVKTDFDLMMKEKEQKEKEMQQKIEEEKQIQIENQLKSEELKNNTQEKGLDDHLQYTPLYRKVMETSEQVDSQLKEFVKDETLKKFRSDCQKAINVPVNAISASTASHLLDKLKKLLALLQKQTVIVSDQRVSAAVHPLGPLYCMHYLAEKIVKQGEQVVSSNVEAAYPIASLVIAVWTEIPQFGLLLLARFYKVCPYLIPIFWEREEGETDEDYNKKWGFLYSQGEKEDIDLFLKRQRGVMALYSAIMISPHKMSNANKPHPLSVGESWRWLTATISLAPKADISATLLLQMLEITGSKMMSTYRLQFRKLLHLICVSYLPQVEKVTTSGRGGPVSRLRSFLEGIVSGKSIPPPKGLLAPNFW